jgi:sec-independent protein translocase protein TatA
VPIALLFPLGHTELLLILVIVMIVFGIGKLPKVFAQLGAGIKEFRDAAQGKGDDDGTDATGGEVKPKPIE